MDYWSIQAHPFCCEIDGLSDEANFGLILKETVAHPCMDPKILFGSKNSLFHWTGLILPSPSQVGQAPTLVLKRRITGREFVWDDFIVCRDICDLE